MADTYSNGDFCEENQMPPIETENVVGPLGQHKLNGAGDAEDQMPPIETENVVGPSGQYKDNVVGLNEEIREVSHKRVQDNPSSIVTKEHVCTLHLGVAIEYWCDSCLISLCKYCLASDHKKCDWNLIINRVQQLHLECQADQDYMEEKIQDLRYELMKNDNALKLGGEYIKQFKGLQIDLQTYHGLLVSLHNDAESNMVELECCKQLCVTDYDKLEILNRKTEIISLVKEMLTLPESPRSPLLLISEIYQVGL